MRARRPRSVYRRAAGREPGVAAPSTAPFGSTASSRRTSRVLVGGVAERDPVLGELVLVVDPDPPVGSRSRPGRGRPRAAPVPSHTGGVVMSTYEPHRAAGSWNVASQPRSTSAPAPGTSPTWAVRRERTSPGRPSGAGRDAEPVAVLVAAEVASRRTPSAAARPTWSSRPDRAPGPRVMPPGRHRGESDHRGLRREHPLRGPGDDVLVARAGELGEVVHGVGVDADQDPGLVAQDAR